MLLTLLVASSLNCAPATHSSYDGSWTPEDQRIAEHAAKRCGERYKGSPCLKHIQKTEPGVYRVLCAAEQSKVV